MQMNQRAALRVEQHTLSTTTPRLQLNYMPVGIGLRNKGATDATLLVNPFTGDTVTLEAGAYREYPLSSSGFKLLSGDLVEVTTFFTHASVAGDRPRYPGFGGSAGNDPYSYRDGFVYTPVAGGGVRPADQSVYEIKYWVLGEPVASSLETYPETLVQVVMKRLLAARSSGLIENVHALYEAFSLPVNKEYIGGLSVQETFDPQLAKTTVTLSPALPRYAALLPVVGAAFQNTGTVQVLVRTFSKEDATDAETLTVPVGGSVEVSRDLRYVELVSADPGQSLTLTFSGRRMKVLQFAPFLNVYYPIGLKPEELTPMNAGPWLAQQTEFEQGLANSQYTGRVVYYREAPTETDPSPVWNADHAVATHVGTQMVMIDRERFQKYPNFLLVPELLKSSVLTDHTRRSRGAGADWQGSSMSESAQRIFEHLYVFDGPYTVGRAQQDFSGSQTRSARRTGPARLVVAGTEEDVVLPGGDPTP